MRELSRSGRLAAAGCAAIVALCLAPLSPLAASEGGSLTLIFDASGSMWGQIEGENKIVIARRVLGELVDGLAPESEVGLVAYGHRREGDCGDIETVVPIGPLDRQVLKGTVEALNPKGKTPITGAVERAFEGLEGRQGGTVILISDGLETCGGDPCMAVRDARQRGLEFVLHVVGFDVAGEDVSQLECAAQAGDGLFFSAENAEQLSEALTAAVAMPAEVPAGRLSVKAVADGELQDAAVLVVDAGSGEEAGEGRTYASPETNPRRIPLADGRYSVEVQAVGIRGDVTRRFEIEIADGGAVEREVDFSTGELAVGVTRNGDLSDALFRVSTAGDVVATGRTYTAATSNPAAVRLTAGTYDVEIESVEIAGKPSARFEGVEIEPGGSAELSQAFASGTLRVGAVQGGELVDAVVRVIDAETGSAVDQARTYTRAVSNPASFTLEPGRYRLAVGAVRLAGRPSTEIEVTVAAGATVEQTAEF